MAKPTLSISINQDYLGVNLVGTFSNAGVLTVTRLTDDGGRVRVRGMDGVAVSTASYGVVDSETPIDVEIWYELSWTSNTVSADNTTFVSPAASGTGIVVGASTGKSYVVRDLFKQKAAISTSWTLGPMNEETIGIRGGIFSVIGRADPVVVIDSRESVKGTLRLLTMDRTSSEQVESIVGSGDPLLLQVPDDHMIGTHGVLYFQPTSVKKRRPVPDVRDPRRAFDIDYVAISPPPGSVIYPVPGSTYTQIQATYATYAAMTSTGRTYFTVVYGTTFGYF